MWQIRHALVHYLVGAVFLISVSGCDDHHHHSIVDFSVSCASISCFDVDETTVFITEDGNEIRTCAWFCADFDVFTDAFVELTFERQTGGCFELVSEFIADGIC